MVDLQPPHSELDTTADGNDNGNDNYFNNASNPNPNSIEPNELDEPSPKKHKPLSSFSPSSAAAADGATVAAKKPKKKSKSNNVWTKSTSRKKPKKKNPNHPHIPPHPNGPHHHNPPNGPHHSSPLPSSSAVLITPLPRFPDKSDDSPDLPILLSRFHKAEKVDLSDDRLTAGSTKGYRMARATRGVVEGAWYFEIKVVHFGETGHTRLGWTMEKGDLQAPVGYDGCSYGYRDVDGSKVHKALREKYGGVYGEGDVIGFYINLPEGEKYAPKPPHLVWYKGQSYMYSADGKDEAPKIVPGE